MSTAGIPFSMLGGIAAEAAKAGSIPVTGAVVIAPFTGSPLNYGSLGGKFTAVGEPVYSTDGAAFDGNDALYLISGVASAFTCTFKAYVPSALAHTSLVNVCNSITSSTPSLAVETYPGTPGTIRGALHGSGLSSPTYPVTAPTTNVWTLLCNPGSEVSIYRDGTYQSSINTPTNKDTLIVGAAGQWSLGGSGLASFSTCVIANLTLYHSALSVANRELIRAWTAAS